MDLRKTDTPEARKIWADVEEVAARAPEWVKEMVKQRLEEYNTPEAARTRREECEREQKEHELWLFYR